MAVQSRLDYVKQNTGTINSSIKSASISSGIRKTSFPNSSANCPSKEPSVVETFLGTCKEVFRRTEADLTNVSTIGDDFVKMDNVMAKISTSLNMQVTSSQSPLGEVTLAEDKEFDSPTNAEIRKEIEKAIAENGYDFKLIDRTENTGRRTGSDYGSNYAPRSAGGRLASAPSSQTPKRSTETGTTPEPKHYEIPTMAPTEPRRVETRTTPRLDEISTSPGRLTIQGKVEPKAEKITGSQQVMQTAAVTKLGADTISEKKSLNKFVNTKPTEDEVVEQPFIETEPVQEQPIITDYTEDELIEQQLNADIVEIEEPEPVQEPSKGLKAMGIASGIGLAVGAAAYGASKMIKKKEEDEEEDSDYGWEA